MEDLNIGPYRIGSNSGCFIVAEIGVNHRGSMATAEEMVEAAAGSGADAVKFQLVNPTAVFHPDDPFYKAYQENSLTESEYRQLKRHADDLGVLFFGSFSDPGGVVLLDSLDAPALKIASMHLTNEPLVRLAAETGRPIVLSTGMATLDEVKRAVELIRATGNHQILLMHCIANYPATFEELNLRCMQTLRSACDLHVGFSDHTQGWLASAAAAALEAVAIEKHFSLGPTHDCLDKAVSLGPDQFQQMVGAIRAVEDALGTSEKVLSPEEELKRDEYRLSVVAARDLPMGHTLDENDLTLRRPGSGLPPRDLAKLVGQKTKRAVSAGELISWETIE
jgi:sialic acid synthase SpsE